MKESNKKKDPLKDQLREYLKNHGEMAPSRFATLSGAPRYSIDRFVKQERAGVSYETRVLISSFMLANP